MSQILNAQTESTEDRLAHAKLLVEGENETKLFVISYDCLHEWIMVSPKTGLHSLKEAGDLEPIMTERVKAHWSGFQTNQSR